MDLVAGVSIGFMVVPQGMSYALLAGLPAVFGLYGAFVPVLVYAIFGSSRHLAVGPVAVTSLLLRNSLVELFPDVKNIRDPNNPGALAEVQAAYNSAAIQVRHRGDPAHLHCTPWQRTRATCMRQLVAMPCFAEARGNLHQHHEWHSRPHRRHLFSVRASRQRQHAA